jgi:PleD family two-component response regulator
VQEKIPDRTDIHPTQLRDRLNTIRGYLVIVHDITHRKLMEEQLRLAAITDALTDLPNRRQFEERFVESVISRRVIKCP